MKKYVLVAVILLKVLIINAQKVELKEVERLIQHQDIKQAEALLNQAIYQEQQNKAALFLYKSFIEQDKVALDNTTDDNLMHLDSAYYFYKETIKQSLSSDELDALKSALERLSGQYYMMAVSLFNDAHYSEALSTFEKSLLISEKPPLNQIDSSNYYNVAICAEKANNWKKIDYYYHRLMAFYPSNAQFKADYIRLLKKYKGKSVYLKRLRKELQADASMLLYDEMVAYCFEEQQIDSAVFYMDKSLELYPNNPKLLYVKASFLQEQNKINQANLLYRKILRINPKHIDAAYNLGVNLYEEARFTVQNKPNNYSKKVNTLISESIQYFKLVTQSEPNNQEVKDLLESCYKIQELTR